MLARGLATAIVVAILDQLSKAAVLDFFAGRGFGDRETVTSFFNLALTYNRGISFGLFNGAAGMSALVFSFAAAAIVAVLIYWLSRASSPFLAVAIGLIIFLFTAVKWIGDTRREISHLPLEHGDEPH